MHLRHGIFWIRPHGELSAGWQIKAPWCAPLFSERYGYQDVRLRLLGFRLLHLAQMIPRPTLRLVATEPVLWRYHPPVAYVTFTDVAEAIGGRKRLREDLLQGHAADLAADDDDPHPFFDEKEAAASQLVNDTLRAAGLAVPLSPAAIASDSGLREAIAYIVIGKLAAALSNKQTYMTELEKRGLDYLALMAGGDVVVIGAEPTTETVVSGISGRRVDVDMFDRQGSVERMFPDLGSENF